MKQRDRNRLGNHSSEESRGTMNPLPEVSGLQQACCVQILIFTKLFLRGKFRIVGCLETVAAYLRVFMMMKNKSVLVAKLVKLS